MPAINRACNIMKVSFTCLFPTRPCPLHGVRRHLPMSKPFFESFFLSAGQHSQLLPLKWRNPLSSLKCLFRSSQTWVVFCSLFTVHLQIVFWENLIHLLPLLHLRQKFYSLCVARVGTEWEVECADGYVSGETEPDEPVSWLKTIVVSQREQNWKAGFAEDSTLISK